MQKKIIALAVAGLVSGVAFAQTNVTVYGIIDQGFAYSKSDNGLTGAPSGTNKFSGLKDGGMSGSRFGFKGEEALGNGLKAIFTMEYGKDSDSDTTAAGTNGTSFFVRQAWVGLTNNMGTLTLGRQYNAAGDIYSQNTSDGVVSAMPVDALQGQLGSQIRSGGGNARQDNVIKYVSPTFSGFSARANYSFGEAGKNVAGNGTLPAGFSAATEASTTDNGRYSIAGSYANGPFGVDVAYAAATNVRTTYNLGSTLYNGQGQDIDEWYIGGRYDFKVVKVSASYQDMDNDTKVANANTGSKMWQVGLSAPVGAKGTVMLQYAKIDFDSGNYTTGTKPDGGNSGWGIGYNHALSKRTTLYTYVSQLDYDKDTGSTGDWIGGIAAAGEKTSTINMGVRHAF